MAATELIDRLAEHRTLGSAPRKELEWLVEHGTVRQMDTGDMLSVKGVPVSALYIILSGRLGLFIDRGAGQSRVVESHAGGVTGLLPFSRLTVAPGNSCALEPSEILALPRECLQEMTRTCYEVTAILVHTMLDRTRMFTSQDLLNEKMISLGKLSAGLAHELNNPASAIERCADLLEHCIGEGEDAAYSLAAMELSAAQIAAVDTVRAHCFTNRCQVERTPLQQSDREEEIVDWLASRGLPTATAGRLAETEITFEALDQLAGIMDGLALNAALQWAAAGSAVRKLTVVIQESAMRISSLVTAVKGFTHMDQANVAEAVDLEPHLKNTIAVLRSKASAKSAAVSLQMDRGLPKVRGFAAELNQVWGNLLENALDAIAEEGRVDVIVVRDNERVLVRFVDDGPGVPAEIRDRIFDPFFTTKPQGQGTGLGLDIVRRLVRHNDGAVELESRPGETEFWVSLPVAEDHSA